MEEFFKRQIELWGKDVQDSLATKTIAIVGAGGLGSSLCMALGAVGLQALHVIDFDEVNLHNIHRQIAFRLQDEGKNKARINAELIHQRSPFTQAFAHECDFDSWCKKQITVDLIVDATDNFATRIKIDNYAKQTNISWVYGTVEEFVAQVCLFDKASFGDFFATKEHHPKGVAPPMVMQTASLQANLALRYLAQLEVAADTIYYQNFNKNGEFVVQKFPLALQQKGK